MTPTDVELVRGLYDAFRRHDTEKAFEVFAEDIEWDTTGFETPGLGAVYRGHDGVRQFWRQWLEAWQEISWEAEYEQLSGGRVRVRVHQRNQGRDSGIWVDQPPYEQLWTIEDGLVTRVEYHAVD